MLRQFNRFLVLALLVGAALYITLTNSNEATIRLGPNLTLTTYAGVIYIGVFALGCIAASLVGLFFGFKSYLRERKLRAAERAREGFCRTFEKARDLMAGGDWAAARDLWEQIIHRDEENVIARVELSRCLEALNDSREALRVLDATRASSRSSAEVLFRAAELNRKLGNKTAASDNLGLILTAAPSRKALELARDINEELGRIGDAIEFQNELEKIGYASDETGDARRRLAFAQMVSEAANDSALRDSLTGFVKRNPTFVPALEKLASLEISRGDVEASAELLVKAAKAAKGDISKWKAVVDLWLHTTQGEFTRRAERAIAAARSASQDTAGRVRLEAELLLIRTLLAANRFQDAERAIDSLPALAERELRDFPADIHAQWLTQKGYSLAQMGKARETASLWEELAAPGQHKVGAQPTKGLKEKQAEPSPALSTP